jgi:FPC/CPF motif-containing protein YcgG
VVTTRLPGDALAGLIGDLVPPDVARRIAERIGRVEGVRVEVARLNREADDENRRHRDAVAAIRSELVEWQGQCPHPDRGFVGTVLRCDVCGAAIPQDLG